MNIKGRFEKIINDCYSGNKRAFATSVGISTSVVENIVGKREGKPSFDILEKVCANAQINPEWLLTGKGPMLKEASKDTPSGSIVSESQSAYGSDTGNLIKENKELREQVKELKDQLNGLKALLDASEYTIKLLEDIAASKDTIIDMLNEKINTPSSTKVKSTPK